jgi:hypothetical protein
MDKRVGRVFFKFATKLFSERAGHASARAREMVQGEFLTILTTVVVRWGGGRTPTLSAESVLSGCGEDPSGAVAGRLS